MNQAAFGTVVQKKMKIQHPPVGAPFLKHLVRSVVIRPFLQAEPAHKPCLSPDVVTGEDVEPSKASQHDVLGRPSSNTGQSAKARHYGRVRLVFQRIEAQFLSVNGLGDGNYIF